MGAAKRRRLNGDGAICKTWALAENPNGQQVVLDPGRHGGLSYPRPITHPANNTFDAGSTQRTDGPLQYPSARMAAPGTT